MLLFPTGDPEILGQIRRCFGCLVWLTVCTVLWFGFAAAQSTPRTGFVTLQFDDSHDLHYSHIFPILENYDFKGSFGYVVESSDLGIEHDAWKMVEIYQAGHEIQDHTTRHNYMWGTHVDTLDDGNDEWIEYTFTNVAGWDSLCQRSQDILDSLGIEVVGWNQPGGGSQGATCPGHPGWRWIGMENDSLYATIAARYPYALGFGVSPQTAHLNLRGHNCPDRYPFFNVPHMTIDGEDIGAIRTGIADAVASGLWYLAVSHAPDLEEVARVESVAQWLHANNVEVLTCFEGWQRVAYGTPDPLANQLPQAAMSSDLDGNAKPDGFIGSCILDTTSTPPVPDVNCLQASGEVEFLCYGPEVGANAFSVWMKSLSSDSAQARIILIEIGFEWDLIDDHWTTVTIPTEWTKFDTTSYPTLLVDVEDAVDRIRCIIRPLSPDTLLVAYPELLLVPVAGVRGSPEDAPRARLRITPNPVVAGGSCCVGPASRICIYDARGRCVLCDDSHLLRQVVTFDTAVLAPGVYFARDPDQASTAAKIVISK